MPLIFSRYGFYDKGDTLASLLEEPVADFDDRPSCDADCGLWLWRSDEPMDELFRCAELSPEQIAAYNAMASISRRREFLTGIAMVSSILGGRLSHHDNGAPLIIGDERRISLSHTAELVAMAVDRKPVGVDIEPLSRDMSRVAGRMFSADERAVANDISLWCLKEAAYKAYGHEGIDFRRDIRVSRLDDGRLTVSVSGNTTEAVCLSFDGMAVAVTV